MHRLNSELSQVGYAIIDLDGNGEKELIITDPSIGYVYDLYTMSDGEVVHLISSTERNSNFLRENGYIEYQWSDSAAKSGHDFYQLKDEKLIIEGRVTLDAEHALEAGIINDPSEANDENCYFISTSDRTADYQSVTADEAAKKLAS